jgi:hypothetical protein
MAEIAEPYMSISEEVTEDIYHGRSPELNNINFFRELYTKTSPI